MEQPYAAGGNLAQHLGVTDEVRLRPIIYDLVSTSHSPCSGKILTAWEDGRHILSSQTLGRPRQYHP